VDNSSLIISGFFHYDYVTVQTCRNALDEFCFCNVLGISTPASVVTEFMYATKDPELILIPSIRTALWDTTRDNQGAVVRLDNTFNWLAYDWTVKFE
jgi:hypothetical protein